MKKGLIMEGGALRGMFTAGVLDVLMENGIDFDGAVGVSAGAVFGCNIKSRQIGRAVRYNIANCKNPRYCSFRSLLFTGDMFGVKYCYEKIPYELDPFDYDTYKENPLEFYAVVTDINTGKPLYHKCDTLVGEDMNWLRASASMPLAARIVKADGYELLDGGISDSVPLKFFEVLGYNKNLVILTQPKGYVKEPASMGLIKRKYKKYPNLIKTMENRHVVYNETSGYINKKEDAGDIFVIRPAAPLPIGRIEHKAERIKETYELGRKAATEALDDIKSFFEGE